MAFHTAILDACHNDLLAQLSDTITMALRLSRRLTVSVPGSSLAAMPAHWAVARGLAIATAGRRVRDARVVAGDRRGHRARAERGARNGLTQPAIGDQGAPRCRAMTLSSQGRLIKCRTERGPSGAGDPPESPFRSSLWLVHSDQRAQHPPGASCSLHRPVILASPLYLTSRRTTCSAWHAPSP